MEYGVMGEEGMDTTVEQMGNGVLDHSGWRPLKQELSTG